MSYDVEFSRLRCALASTVRDGVGRTVIDHARSPSETEAGRIGVQLRTRAKGVYRSLGKAESETAKTKRNRQSIRHLGSRIEAGESPKNFATAQRGNGAQRRKDPDPTPHLLPPRSGPP